jgi:hypothetical protein
MKHLALQQFSADKDMKKASGFEHLFNLCQDISLGAMVGQMLQFQH